MSWMIVLMSKGGLALGGGAGRNRSESTQTWRNQRIVMRPGGQYVANTLPIRFWRGTVPHARESQEEMRLSPIMKKCPGASLIGAIVRESRRAALIYGSFSGLPLM